MGGGKRRRERMSGVDTAWLRMDRPSNLMQIVGVMRFVGQLDVERLKRLLEERLLRYPRFRQLALLEADGAWWEDDPDFDLDGHVRQSILPAPADVVSLQAFVARLCSEPLNPVRPRWDCHIVETKGGDSALILRVHHAIADGIALVRVFEALTDAPGDAEQMRQAAERRAREASGVIGDSLFGAPANDSFNPDGRVPEAVDSDPWGKWASLAESSIRMGGRVWGDSQKILHDLLHDPDRLREMGGAAAGVLTEVARLALMGGDSPTRLKGLPGTVKRVAWSEPLPLPQVKAVGKVLGCSVNDMLISSVAGALRAYLLAYGDVADDVDAWNIRVLVPVNLSAASVRAAHETQLGNHFGLVALDLPVGIDNPLARLYCTRQRMEALKHSPQAAVAYALLNVLGAVPGQVQESVLDMLAGKATAVVTNVPGPGSIRLLAGTPIAEQMFWVPQSGNIGLGISILSYDGKVQFGLIADKRMVPDPQAVVAGFTQEFEKLLWLVLMEPWERLHDPQAVEHALVS